MASLQAQNVGILAMELYFPPTYVEQEALEAYDGATKGKYTNGLGQERMAFCTDVEDVISMGLTAVASLLDKYEIDPKQIGRLDVGTRTVLDHGKSVKTYLMQIFEECGNTDMEGVDSINACYGGTAALFNCVNWIESSSWDGRYGLVVCTDSLVHAEGPARPAGGAAAVAMLVGVDAPIVLETKFRGSHMAHAYFHKHDPTSESQVVDPRLLEACYFQALDTCYKYFCSRYEKFEGTQFSVKDADYFVFHYPFNKVVQKSSARLFFNDFLRNASYIDNEAKDKLAPFANLSGNESYLNKELEQVSQQVGKPVYDTKVEPSTLIPKQVGNTYTAAVYLCLASLIHNKHSTLVGSRVVMFSYGSGLTATMFSLRIKAGKHPFTVSNIESIMNVGEKLKARHEFPPEKFVEIIKRTEHCNGAKNINVLLSKDTSLLAPGTYYLTEVDAMYRKLYAKKPGTTGACEKGGIANHQY